MWFPHSLLFILATAAAGKVFHRHPTDRCKYYQELDCPEGTRWSQTSKNCEPRGAGQTCPRRSDQTCDVTNPCTGSLQCLDGKCACAEDHFLVNEESCAPKSELGGQCVASGQCRGANVMCLANVCRCEAGFIKEGQNKTDCVPSYDGIIWANNNPQVVSSPGWPGNYFNDLDIGYRVQAMIDTQKVKITFTHMYTEDDWDYLIVFDGQNDKSGELGRLTGTVAGPKSFNSSGPDLFIKFHSDSSTVRNGFRATIIAVD